MTLPDTVQKYSEHAAEVFIQTAVFVDDKIYESRSSVSEKPKTVLPPRTRKRVSKRTDDSVEGMLPVWTSRSPSYRPEPSPAVPGRF